MSDDDALEFARSRGMIYLEASAKTKAGIRQAFEEVRSAGPSGAAPALARAVLQRLSATRLHALGAIRRGARRADRAHSLCRCRACRAGGAADHGHARAARGHARRRRRGRRAQQARCGRREGGRRAAERGAGKARRRQRRLRLLRPWWGPPLRSQLVCPVSDSHDASSASVRSRQKILSESNSKSALFMTVVGRSRHQACRGQSLAL